MRYGIVEHHEDGADARLPYFVVDSQAPSMERGMLGPKFTEAEASIVAFALTTVAKGGVLCAIDQATLGVMFAHGFGVVAYDGPTEGVA